MPRQRNSREKTSRVRTRYFDSFMFGATSKVSGENYAFSLLLQEDDFNILQETDSRIFLEQVI